MSVTDTEQADFGCYAPSSWANSLLKITRSLSATGVQKKLAFLLRKPALKSINDVVDIETNSLSLRLYPHQNLSDKRLLSLPDMLDGPEREYIAGELPQHAVVIDIGANIGGYSMLLKQQRPDFRILAVEPDPLLVQRFTFNQALNPLLQDIRLEPSAISDRNGTLLLDTSGSNKGENHILEDSDARGDSVSRVDGLTLYRLQQKHDIVMADLIKLDIEGHEYPVMKQFFEESPRECWPEYLQIEQYRQVELNETVSLCLSHGYKITMRSRMNVILKKAKSISSLV